jgi:hypothetical protein
MRNALYIIAILLIIFWAVGYFAYAADGVIHVLLVLAAIVISVLPGSGSNLNNATNSVDSARK